MRDDIEAKMAGYASGTHAARLAATPLDGQLWRESDTGGGLLYVGNGSSWESVVGSRGAVSIATSESRTNTAYGTLTTPDQVTGIVLPTNGLIAVWYQATWQESVHGAAQAGLFLGATQVVAARTTSGATVAVSTFTNGTVPINTDAPLFSAAFGLDSTGTSAYAGDVTTGQIVGQGSLGAPDESHSAGPCWIFASAGTYTVSVQFKAASGTVAAKNRKLWVQALSFA